MRSSELAQIGIGERILPCLGHGTVEDDLLLLVVRDSSITGEPGNRGNVFSDGSIECVHSNRARLTVGIHRAERRAELEEMVLLETNSSNDDFGAGAAAGSADDDEDVDESVVAAQEERIAELQKRRAALSVELHSIQQKHDQMAQKVAGHRAELEALSQKENGFGAADVASLTRDPDALRDLHVVNHKLKEELGEMAEIKTFYEDKRLLLEDLVGVRVPCSTASRRSSASARPRRKRTRKRMEWGRRRRLLPSRACRC